jgi:hypothetical protein
MSLVQLYEHVFNAASPSRIILHILFQESGRWGNDML